MRDKVVSFLVAYCVVPFMFYTVNMICQEFYSGGLVGLIPLTIALTLVSWGCFRFVLEQRIIKINSPVSSAVGASIGLFHFFTPYLIMGTYLIWRVIPLNEAGRLKADIPVMLQSLINPLVYTKHYLCDGSPLAIIFSILLFFGIALKRKKITQSHDA